MNKNLKKILTTLSLLSILVTSVVDSTVVLAYQPYYNAEIKTETNKMEILGASAGEQFGASVSKGDINGDKVDDLVVGAPFYNFDGRRWTGKVSVFFGRKGAAGKSINLKTQSADYEIYGRSEGDQLGISVATGDFNNDGFDDILMGAYNAASDNERPGRAFLVFGQKTFTPAFLDLNVSVANIEFVGEGDKDGFGIVVQMGDINRDFIDDVLIGAPYSVSPMSTSNEETGNVYGYFGSTKYIDTVATPMKFFGEDGSDVIFAGHEKGERFGSAIEVVNVIGNAFNDIAISAYFASGVAGKQVGKVYLYSGAKRYSKYVAEADSTLQGNEAYDWFGFSLASGTATDDGWNDLMISSFPYSNPEKRGSAYVLFGKQTFGDMTVTYDNADYAFKGGRGDSFMGSALGIGDFDNDKWGDFVIGAPGIGVPKATGSGELYLYYRNEMYERMPYDVKKDEATAFVEGENADDWFGAKLTILDFNGDGFDDIAVSSRYSDLHDPVNGVVTESNNGKVYILLGQSVPFGKTVTKKDPGDEMVTRGELVASVVDKFNIKERRKDFLDSCYSHREFCFYAFMGMSNFNGIKLQPDIVLYPDIAVNSKYYEPVTVATMLGAVSGVSGKRDTPFKPDDPVTRIQALKVILGINQLVKPMYRFELIGTLGSVKALETQDSYFDDVNPSGGRWWYPRFTNYAYENSLVEDRKFFRPDDLLTKEELEGLSEKTLELVEAGV